MQTQMWAIEDRERESVSHVTPHDVLKSTEHIELRASVPLKTEIDIVNPLILPEPIATYFASDRRSADAVARCFTTKAVVRDEGHTYAGRESIKAWKSAASSAYTYTSEPFAIEHADDKYIVTSRVAGTFPGSPINLRYCFRLEGGLIAALEITP